MKLATLAVMVVLPILHFSANLVPGERVMKVPVRKCQLKLAEKLSFVYLQLI